MLVTMKADAAKAAFGSFRAEHMEPAFFEAGASFTCSLFFGKDSSLPCNYATRCSMA